MRRDGDILLAHLSAANGRVVLCAPFIKSDVLERLINVVPTGVSLEVFTRWHPAEVAAGVSDLEVFDLVANRPTSRLRLCDNLHAKLYIRDDELLTGSANLTATALGWCDTPNVELLTTVAISDPQVQQCLESLAGSRDATEDERDRVRVAAEAIMVNRLPLAAEVVDEMASTWFPRLGVPESLFLAYRSQTRERLSADSLEAADHDLAALDVAPGLDRQAFTVEVGRKFCAMPAMVQILDRAEHDLTDDAAIALIAKISRSPTIRLRPCGELYGIG